MTFEVGFMHNKAGLGTAWHHTLTVKTDEQWLNGAQIDVI